MRMMGKVIFLWCYVYLWAPLRNLKRTICGTSHTTILVYHRVSNESLDSITVKISQFQRQLDILTRNYQVVSMDQFLSRRGLPRRKKWVVITFDDGYFDNYAAAQMLYKAQLPCTFFVSTGIVGTSRSFPLDIRMNRKIRVLSWKQIQEMSALGFHIANHSVNHIDMGITDLNVSLYEIRKASKDLVTHLGNSASEKWFAYPFGRQENITEDIKNQLNSLGIDYCFSAYGGTNPKNFDPFNILRQGVNYGFSDLAFKSAIEGYRTRIH